MININQSYINNEADNIYLNITISEDSELTSLFLQNSIQYNSLEDENWIDLSFLIDETVGNIEITISEEDAELLNFYGIYFVTLKYLDSEGQEQELVIVLSNLNNYYDCATNFILKSSICNRNLFSPKNCGQDSDILLALSINLLIDSIKQSIEICNYSDIDIFLKRLNKICKKCNGCNTIEVYKSSECNNCN